MRFAGIRTKAERRLDGRFRERDTCRRMIEAKAIKEIVNPSQLAIGLEERRVVHDSLVQQIGCLKQVGSRGSTKGARQKETLRSAVEIEGGQVRGRRLLNRQFLGGGELGVKLLHYVFRDFTLNGKEVFQIAVV